MVNCGKVKNTNDLPKNPFFFAPNLVYWFKILGIVSVPVYKSEE